MENEKTYNQDLTNIATLSNDPLATYSLHGRVTKTRRGSRK